MPLNPQPHSSLFNCLIRTHHISSRKKLHRVRRAAEQLRVDRLLVRTGGCPGIMFAEAHDEETLKDWVNTVQALQYKDFRCIAKPSPSVSTTSAEPKGDGDFEETTSMKTFAERLENRGLGVWYKKLMFT